MLQVREEPYHLWEEKGVSLIEEREVLLVVGFELDQ